MTDKKPQRTIAVTSIGCRTNQEEMVSLSGQLAGSGYRCVEDLADAEIILVNTCSVTAATEAKTRKMLASIVEKSPEAKILVTGCLAQQEPELLASMPNVGWVVGNGRKHEIAEIIRKLPPGIYHSSLSADNLLPLDTSDAASPAGQPSLQRTRYSVKIQEGCDFHCTYCIVPSLRGPSRSASFDKIVAACSAAVDRGYKELVLTGTHIGQFAHENGLRLEQLVEKLIAIDGDFRIRLTSLDPRDCSDGILSLVMGESKVCRHLHVSLQSCSPEVLTAMHRPVDATMKLIARLTELRKQHPDLGYGADIIVGFPGETDAHFEETASALATLGLSYAHVFRYSKRPGTPAAAMKMQIREHAKTLRSNRLREIVSRASATFLQQNTVFPQRIIVESTYPVRGLTGNFIHVEVPGMHADRNSWLDVAITGIPKGRYTVAKVLVERQ